MNTLRVNSIDEYQSQLMGYNIIGNKIIYLTEGELCTLRVGLHKNKKESIKIKGTSILNFVISKRGYIAFLLKNKSIEIRRLDKLSEVVHKWTNILIFPEENYPRMKWDYEELYLVYADSLQILDLKGKKRKGYTDIIVDYQKEQINDIIITNVMDSQKAAILQLNNTLIFTIIPIPFTETSIPSLNSVISLYSPSLSNDSKREYIAILSNNRTLTIMNMLNLKQICEVDLQSKSNDLLQMQADANCECILIRYISRSTLQVTRNVIYRINSQEYYSECLDYFQENPSLFFKYHFQINITENLTLFPFSLETYDNELFDYYSLIFFKKGNVYSVSQLIPHSYSQSGSELKCRASPQCQQNVEWRNFIETYLYLQNRREDDEMYEQQRQLHQYNMIKGEFEGIIAKFSQRINKESKKNTLTQNKVQQEWDQYMMQIAKQRNFMPQTMKLFKIQPQIIRKNQAQTHSLPTELQVCMNDIQNRQKRIDARIQQKKKEIQHMEKLQKLRSTQEEIQRYQEDYEKFVAEFMQETQRKEKEENQKKLQKNSSNPIDQRFILTLPHLTQAQRKLISITNNESQPQLQPQHQHPTKAEQQATQRKRMEQLLISIQQKISPILSMFQPLIERLTSIQLSGLQRIKKNEEEVSARCSLDLQRVVKNGCKRMLLNLSTRIKKRIENTTRQIYQLQDKNRRYYQESIQQFKRYIKYQIANRIELFYKSRKKLQTSLIGMSKESVVKQQVSK